MNIAKINEEVTARITALSSEEREALESETREWTKRWMTPKEHRHYFPEAK